MQKLLRLTLHSYDVMDTIYFHDFSILVHFRERERERERQLQLTIKSKHTFAPIGRAIFSRIWKDSASFKS